MYRQLKNKDTVERIQVEDRSQVIGNGQDVATGGARRRQLQVPEAHWDGITDLLSVGPDLLISSGQEGVIKLWKIS